jgi:hypothetical protein
MKIVMRKFWELIYSLLDAVQKLIGGVKDRADILLIATFVVAALRQMGVNGHFIGYDPASTVGWEWFQPLEVVSGLFMAFLEGIALAFVARRWQKMRPVTATDWVVWGILAVGMFVMLLSILVYVAMYAFAAQRDATVAEIFNPAQNFIWNLMVSGVNPLIALLIGIVVGQDDTEKKGEAIAIAQGSPVGDGNNGGQLSEHEEAWLSLIDLLKTGDKISLLPNELAEYAKVSEFVAVQVIEEATAMGMLGATGS